MKTSVQPLVNTNYNSERYQREQAVANAIASLKAANKATREAKEKEIEEEYRNAENEAWNQYVIASQTAYILYATAYQDAKNDYRSASTEAENDYISTVLIGWNTYNNKVDNLDALFEAAVEQAGNSGFNPATFFNNGVSGNQGNVVLVKGTKTNDTASDKHWSDSINANKNGVNDWIAAPFKWIGNKISPLLPNFRETDPQEGAERRQELSQRRVTVDKLNNIKSSALNDMNRAVFTEDTIHAEILHDDVKADYMNHIADSLQDVQKQLAMFPLTIIGGAFVEKGGEILIKTADGKTIGNVAKIVIRLYKHSDEALAALNLASDLLKVKNIWASGTFRTAEESLVYHYEKHRAKLGATSMKQYLNQAEQFSKNLRGARRTEIKTEGLTVAIRYEKAGKYITLRKSDKKIIDFYKITLRF